MISLTNVYHCVAATVPLYATMFLAFISIRFWKLFTPDQCAGINKFVAKFSIPLLSFQVISSTNPYKMNLRLVLADFAQKILAILIVGGVAKFRSGGGLRWIITGVSLSTLPNTLILGIPLLRAMYGDEGSFLIAQIVCLQSILWYNLLLFLFELNATKAASVTPSSEATGVTATTEEDETKDGGDELKLRNGRKYETLLIFLKVGKNLLRNPNTYATVMGVIWASIHFRWGVEMPAIVSSSILILSEGGLGMAMFSLGLFMASQTRIVACGARLAAVAMAAKFIAGPGLMAISSLAIGLRETSLKVAIVQAALPQGIVPFVFAKEYNVHPEILSTGVLFGMLIAMPISLVYYLLLSL
ncbi:LOW QUALITY PROTEIN: auxin efflux carrier component 8 [Eucalyptus grandis]|uniref:LOW QUALITY PROTEIN: auxin efflux carrier component 8 n=1 Tax=Eucalyptus grandis TaxID=71139 RepID=UPI00192EED54|nr:LOW QUALITY PROTEIN: auxin efflux carrier component 8 [Eucalyptus grandis]